MNSSEWPSPVNAPQPIRVSTDANGHPVMVQIRTRQWTVRELCRQWVESNARMPQHRKYFLLRLHNGALCCVYHALDQGKWFRQRISQKHWSQTERSSPLALTDGSRKTADESSDRATPRSHASPSGTESGENYAGPHWVTL